MKLEKFTFDKKSNVLERVIMMLISFTFIAPLLSAIFIFLTFSCLGLEFNEGLKFLTLFVFEYICFACIGMIYF